ncbi:phage tail-collar fiber domain-containing protein, partial [Alteromonas sp. a30]|uniref:phage tail-collar fiber domain-containing protein n=1 Tax=Alteromonas sp. a30 TaxID=2730917 RepID=UPI00228208EC
MTQQFFTIVTDIGAAADANAKALGQHLQLTHFAVGDGGGADFAPDVETLKKATSLTNEVFRGPINEL